MNFAMWIAAVWVPSGFVVAVAVCRHFAISAHYERIWREIETRRTGARLTPAMRKAVRAAQQRLTVAR